MIGKDYKWYVVYTQSKHEKKIAEYCATQGIQCFLPLYRRISFWSDRKKTMDSLLLPNYVFVYISCLEYINLLAHPSVYGFVKSGKQAASVPESQIKGLKQITCSEMEYYSQPLPKTETKDIEITSGPLRGIKGSLINKENEKHFVVQLHSIGQSVYVKMSARLKIKCAASF